MAEKKKSMKSVKIAPTDDNNDDDDDDDGDEKEERILQVPRITQPFLQIYETKTDWEKEFESLSESEEEITEEKPEEVEVAETKSLESLKAPETTEKEVKQKKVIPEDFFYDYEELKYKPFVTEESGLPQNMLQLKYSLGYDCTRRSNLCLIDNDTLMFATGNLLTIINIKTRERNFIMSTSVGGISAIQMHPSRHYCAVAEKGYFPNINIFEVPSFKLYRILKNGTTNSYNFLDFSNDGKLLASQGGDPDYMLTLWDWAQEQIVLRCKAFSQEVYRVYFSADLEGYLTTAGMGHIRFWKMANTFTGLKLQGHLGKFGKTEMSDIEGYVNLPDGKVVSSCEWGNLLVWDGGLIKVQIGRKNNKTCHVGHIQQIFLVEGELMTVGQDGYIRVWDFETVDTADVVDETDVFALEPMNELKISAQQNVQLYCMRSQEDDDEQNPVLWYAQDANGGIWELDLTFSHTSRAPKKLFSFHSGSIKAMDCSPVANLVATTGVDQTIRIFDIDSTKQLCERKFVAKGTSLKWISKKLSPKGAYFIAGFEDGVIRLFEISKPNESSRRGKNDCDIELYQAFKLHSCPINAFQFDPEEKLFVTIGEDCTVFFSKFTENLMLEPIGFVNSSHIPKRVLWHPKNVGKILLISDRNVVTEFQTPSDLEFDTEHSYLLHDLTSRDYIFKSIKSVYLHEKELEEKRKEEELQLLKEREERMRRHELGEFSESESEESENEEEEEQEVWEPYIPELPSPILCAMYADDGRSFWLTLGGYDAGFIYECAFPGEAGSEKAIPDPDPATPLRAVVIDNNHEAGITIMKFSKNRSQLLLGMTDGKIRVHHLPVPGSIYELGPYWEFGIHDSYYGQITSLDVNFQENYLLSSGGDGNLFILYYMSLDEIEDKIMAESCVLQGKEKTTVDDLEDSTIPSLEYAKLSAENDRMMAEANQKKEEVHQHIALLRRDYKHLMEQNAALPENLRLSPTEFEINSTVKDEAFSIIDKKIAEARMKVAWISEKHSLALKKIKAYYKDYVKWSYIDVHAFNSTHIVSTIRAMSLPNDFYEKKEELLLKKETMKFKLENRQQLETDGKKDSKLDENKADEAQKTLNPVAIRLKGVRGERIMTALQRVEEIKKRRNKRKEQWDRLYRDKQSDDYENPKDVAAITEAKENMGDYKLKTADDYVVPDQFSMNTTKSKIKLYDIVEFIYNLVNKFNAKVLKLREEKKDLVGIISKIYEEINRIQDGLKEELVIKLPPLPKLLISENPERKFQYGSDVLYNLKKDLFKRKSHIVLGVEDRKSVEINATATQLRHGSRTAIAANKMNVSGSKTDTFNQLIDNKKFLRESKMSVREISHGKEGEIRKVFKRDQLLKKIEKLKEDFDMWLCLLRHEKLFLDIVVKKGDLRQVTSFEELVLLKEYEKYEHIIAGKVEERFKEKLEMERKIQECQTRIDNKIKDIEKIQDREKALYATFLTSIGENKFADYLVKVFKKKIKRSKKKETDAGHDESEESSSDDSDLEDTDEDSDEESISYDLDVCPSGCDQTLYDNSCTMREKRLDIEDLLMDERKNQETFKKDMDALNKKAKVINSSLEMAEKDLQAFQVEKQRKLNELDVTVILYLQQIQYTVAKKFPLDVSKALVFNNENILQLNNRIKELQAEKYQQKRNKQEERLKHCQLLRDKTKFEQIISKLEDTCNQMIQDKFGQLVDLEVVETVTAHRTNAELEQKAHQLEEKLRNERKERRANIILLKKEIVSATKENTDLLGILRILIEEQHMLELELAARQKVSTEEQRSETQKSRKELERLEQLCNIQTEELLNLKREQIILSQKGGHILPPIEPPVQHVKPGFE
ncbi:cilia- and flagella-associated protein 44-like [Argonauta hians]